MAPDTVEESPRVVSPASTAGDYYDAPMSPMSPLQKEVSPEALVVGTTQLFENDSIRFVPTPTPSPKDPLNLPTWRKWAAVAALSLFGALALAAENVIGAMVPVFVLEYAGVDPKVLGQPQPPGGQGGGQGGLMTGMGGPPLWQVSLLASLPLLVNGIASYFLVPLTIAIGRRPVLLFTGAMAWSGGLWAGYSTSLSSHLAARAFQGLGAGAVEALVPLIIQDFMFIHERNKAISLVGATQGLFVLALGISAPYIVLRLDWRYLYYITAGVGILVWLGLIAFVPETRWVRSDDELAGKQVYALLPGENRPRLDELHYGPRNKNSNFGMFNVETEWRLAARSIWEMIKTTFFPNVLWVILINSMFSAIQNANAQVISSVQIAAGWKFETIGLVFIPFVIASPFVWLFGGFLADKVSNWHARRNGGRREPEAHLLSLIIPLSAGIVGPIVVGYAGQNIESVSTIVVLVGIFLIGFGYLTTSAVVSVYLVESYPRFAGPVLVNVSSLRLVVGFALSFDSTTWIEQLGFMVNFAIYGGIMAGFALGLPIMYIYGKRIRAWTAGRLESPYEQTQVDPERNSGQSVEKVATDDATVTASTNY
ncbi:hypothetical protein J7T55_011394 [Diaporthe amygdali]|uniref:uncharacterized protein n=1 Tax=Phomopsis amygdali TaxID=1214568 RepID=UPI0022FF2606|nr:uncharacterized protein J7T55_011394 [Diaporthe amygdali]KAJ0122933.1 hypothetical protein J7T55_011394 [Diaporthe amygdali]